MKPVLHILLKNYTRSLQRGRRLVPKIIITVLILIPSAVISIFTGFLLASVLKTHFTPEEAMGQFGFYFLIFLTLNILMVSFFSEGHQITLAPFFHLPIRKRYLAHLYQILNLATLWNGFLFLIVISFTGSFIYWFHNFTLCAYLLLFITLLLMAGELVIIFRFMLLNWKRIWFVCVGFLLVIIALAFRYPKKIEPYVTHRLELTSHGNLTNIIVFILVGILIYSIDFTMTEYLFYADSFSSNRIKLFHKDKLPGKRNLAFQFGWLQIRQLFRTKRGPVLLFEGLICGVWA